MSLKKCVKDVFACDNVHSEAGKKPKLFVDSLKFNADLADGFTSCENAPKPMSQILFSNYSSLRQSSSFELKCHFLYKNSLMTVTIVCW